MTVLSCGILVRSFSFFDEIKASLETDHVDICSRLLLLPFLPLVPNFDCWSLMEDDFPFPELTFGALWGPVITVLAEFLKMFKTYMDVKFMSFYLRLF